jgi:hypothetical protein
VWPDKKALQDYRKVTKRDSVELLPEGFSFFLPGHKADRFFEGNRIILQRNASGDDPDIPFRKYLASRDRLFPFHPELWLRADGSIPTRSWFIRRLRQHFPSDVAGHSLRDCPRTSWDSTTHHPSYWPLGLGHFPDLYSSTPCSACCLLIWPNGYPYIMSVSCRAPSFLILFNLIYLPYPFYTTPPPKPLLYSSPNSIIALYGTHANTLCYFGPCR